MGQTMKFVYYISIISSDNTPAGIDNKDVKF